MTVTRFAPSPTGRLHLGHAFAALQAESAARAADGRFLLRIEDIDPTRCRQEHVDGILEDLAWLGLRWEEPVRRQSAHLDDYRAALQRLGDAGLLYPCFCTRSDIQAEIAAAGRAPHGPDGPLYPGICRGLPAAIAAARIAAGEPHALRLDMRRATAGMPALGFREHGAWVAADPAQFGDAVLARKEIPTSYHLAVTVDDALQGVTLVTRAEDLLPATHLHRLLQHHLGLPVPDYRHHGMLRDEGGRRLAKRDGAATLQALRRSGVTPQAVRRQAGF